MTSYPSINRVTRGMKLSLMSSSKNLASKPSLLLSLLGRHDLLFPLHQIKEGKEGEEENEEVVNKLSLLGSQTSVSL